MTVLFFLALRIIRVIGMVTGLIYKYSINRIIALLSNYYAQTIYLKCLFRHAILRIELILSIY